MTRCILHVTDDEFARILQLNHDALVWSNHNRVLIHRLEQMFDTTLMHDLRQYDQCRMEKHHDLRGIERIEKDTRKEFANPRPSRRELPPPTTSTTPDPEMTMPFNQTEKLGRHS